jgi:hypothetical protein
MKQKIQLTGHLAVELKTIIAMTNIYCNAHHDANRCSVCSAFVHYVEQKLDRCVYGDKKPACKKCPIHCYKPEEKKLARTIMVYSGPKMLLKHPILSIKHFIKATKKFPEKIPEGVSNYHLRKK